MNTPLFDSHIHTPLCGHATGTLHEYATTAVRAGLAGICFTDHTPVPLWFGVPSRVRLAQLNQFVEEVECLKQDFAGKLEVRTGLEIDYHVGTEEYVQKIIASHPWDYVIGSVRPMGAWGFDSPEWVDEHESKKLEDMYKEYCLVAVSAAQSGLFDSIGHLGLPEKFKHKYHPSQVYALRVLDAIAGAGISLNFNTTRWRRLIYADYPKDLLILEALHRGIDFVLGSDAHKPQEVGRGFTNAAALLSELKAKTTHYKGRKRNA